MAIRICPACGTELPVGNSVRIDEHNNIICRFCDKPIIAATAEAEAKIVPKTATSSTISVFSRRGRKKSMDEYHCHDTP